MIFYKPVDLQSDGFNSYYELIKSYSNWRYTAILPFVFTCAYTFGFPYIKAWIKLLHAKISIKNESDILDATREFIMPIEKYIKLRDSYYDSAKELRFIIESQSEIQMENVRLTTEHADISAMRDKALQNVKLLKSTLTENKRFPVN